MPMDTLSLKSLSCETEQLHLRPLEEGDEALFHALYTDPETMRFIGVPWTPSQAASRFRKVLRRQDGLMPGGHFLVILRKNGQTALGICGTSHYDSLAMRLEVGMVLLPEGRRLGIAREALTALVGLAFDERLVDEVYARFATVNAAARNLISRVGFRPCGAVERKGQEVAMCEWSVHRSAWCFCKATDIQG